MSVAKTEPASAPEATPAIRSTLSGGETTVQLPRRLPIVRERTTQSNIPNERATRDRLRSLAAALVAERAVVAPASILQLRELAVEVIRRADVDDVFIDYTAVLVNNEVWRDELAQVPYERRLLLLPKCLRVEEHCPAPFDEFGMLCKECGLCSIEDFTREAEELGYAGLIAEGSAIVTAMVETGKIDAIVGVSECIIMGIPIPLGCGSFKLFRDDGNPPAGEDPVLPDVEACRNPPGRRPLALPRS